MDDCHLESSILWSVVNVKVVLEPEQPVGDVGSKEAHFADAVNMLVTTFHYKFSFLRQDHTVCAEGDRRKREGWCLRVECPSGGGTS